MEGEVDIVYRSGERQSTGSHHREQNQPQITGHQMPIKSNKTSSSQGPKTARGQMNVTGALTNAKINKRVVSDADEPTAPPKAGAFDVKHNNSTSTFRRFYDRGDMPCCLESNCRGSSIRWKDGVDISKMDFHLYLPLFFDGLRELKQPYVTIASQGVHELLEHGGYKVLPVIPQLIIPMKNALDTKDPDIMCRTMKVMQQLCRCDALVGQTLVPYYRQLLPTFNLFKNKNKNCGDRIDYGQQKDQNVGDLIEKTLEVLEKTGGEDAFINIKYIVPTYESCIY